MTAERWTREDYEKFLDEKLPAWREARVAMPCTCDYDDCHGWAAVRLGLVTDHEDEEAFRAELRAASSASQAQGGQ